MIDLITNCYGHWKLNENAANSFVGDSSGKGNNGILYYRSGGSNYELITSDQAQSSGNPPYLNGCFQMADYIFIDAGIMGDFGSKLGSGIYVSFWAKTTEAMGAVLGSESGAGDVFVIALHASPDLEEETGTCSIHLADRDGKDLWAYCDGVVAGAWQHFNINIDAANNTVQIYIDNVAKFMQHPIQQTPVNFVNFTNPMYLSAYCGGDDIPTLMQAHKYDGIMVFDKLLSTDEIDFLYNYGIGTEKLTEIPVARPLVGGSLAIG
ncbi:MAG: hypothetical protein KAJ19_11650 [Gammaproteobacteria bacterium]|nr:hypothetical protein [Gammaproteobacteria bacterium]